MAKKSNRPDNEKNIVPLETQERAHRLRFLRQMTCLSMREFAQHCNMGLTTINYWEQGYSSITERGAKKVSNAMREEGIECSVIWLLSGFGEQPRIIDSSKLSKLNYKTIIPTSKQTIREQKSLYLATNEKIQEELDLFKKIHPDHLVYLVKDESMSPLYCQGDLVAGEKLVAKNRELANGADCIIELVGLKECLIRRVRIGHSVNTFDLYVINADSSLEFPPLRNKELASLAPISRIWKLSKS